MMNVNDEKKSLQEQYSHAKNWLKWGPYLSERQWGTVREDYSAGGSAWDYFPHDHARSRVYRWGEDGIAGISDNKQRLCFSIALWNGQDAILKERLFGLTGLEGNHGEDCKELYYYLDNTPTHRYMKYLYKYPQRAYPYQDLVETNKRRTKEEDEYELLDTGIFNGQRYYDVYVEYAKADDEDILIRLTVFNRGDESATITLLPQLWFRNLWAFGLMNTRPEISPFVFEQAYDAVKLTHEELGTYYYYYQKAAHSVFTENETNKARLWHVPNDSPYVKDAFHDVVLSNRFDALSSKKIGTKFSPVYIRTIAAGGSTEIRVRLTKNKAEKNPLGDSFEKIFIAQKENADSFYNELISAPPSSDAYNVQRQAYAGMLWSKQYYNLDIPAWLHGDSHQPTPPAERLTGRNSVWKTLNNEDILSMPDKWEYPWYAAWDLAFHCITLAHVDSQFAKNQLLLFMREWYMHPNGQIPAYEWAFGDVNPPVHAMSCLRVYQVDKQMNNHEDIDFLKKAFSKLLLNFTWWVNRKDSSGKNVFEGGFLGLDNIGVFDRSSALPSGGHLEQADGTAWMAMYCLNMLEMALEITKHDKSFEPMCTKFFEHFALIAESLNRISQNWTGAWDEQDGFFYDVLALPNQQYIPIKVRSLVGLTTLFATLTITKEHCAAAPEFFHRMKWFNDYFKKQSNYTVIEELSEEKVLLTLTPKSRLKRLLHALLDEAEFLSDYGIRSISKKHEQGYWLNIEGNFFGLNYEPAESRSGLFGGNSNWRGPIWMPMNFMIIQSLQKYGDFFDRNCKVEFPTGSGNFLTLHEVTRELSKRLTALFCEDKNGNRPVHGLTPSVYRNEHFKNLLLFYEYFHGDTGRGVGASHQTGWTGIVATLFTDKS